MKNTKAYAGFAAAILMLSFVLCALIVGLSDFHGDPKAAMLPALFAFIGGAALAATCWCYIGANIRHH